MKTTAELIRRLMDLGVSQGQMHRRTGIIQPNLSRWLSNGSQAGDAALRLLELCQQAEAGTLPPLPPPARPAPPVQSAHQVAQDAGVESDPSNPASTPQAA